MSILLVKEEILRFLASPEPETLCIKGKWGVGKTFAWKQYLKEAAALSDGISLEAYSYVSLFGMNSLAELKYGIFEGTISKKRMVNDADLGSLKSTVESAEESLRKNAWLLRHIPFVKDYLGDAAPAFFLTVRNQIVCIDDLERTGDGLGAGDVLGLISFLKEERKCKVILLLNDDALQREDKEKFKTYLEKVIDITLHFDPSPTESIAIALSRDDEASKLVHDKCIHLGISNIRVIKKIEREVRNIESLVSEYDKEVFRQVASSVILFGWAHYQPEGAPTLDFLATKLSLENFSLDRESEPSPEEAAWKALLESYGYRYTDEFDLILIEGVKNGYFDRKKVKKHAEALNRQVQAATAIGSMKESWNLFHDSFDDNQELVLNTLHTSFKQNLRFVTPSSLSELVKLFRELGRTEEALEMIQYYVENREQDRRLFDLSQQDFGFRVTDPDVIKAFAGKCASLPNKLDLRESLLKLSDHWNDNILAALSSAPVDFYYQTFKEANGEDLSRMIDGTLRFDRVVNATDQMKQITLRGKEALKRIGKESTLNAIRVSRYGIKVESNKSTNDSSKHSDEPTD